MTPSGQTICLCMIVKDEAPVIARCLASARPLVDHWIVVDTGSRDGTQDIVQAAMEGLPGELVERPWVDFGHNRSEALALARPHADYSLVIDADDVFEVSADFAMPPLDADSYVVDIHDTSITYQRTQLFKNTLPWRYAGVLHEFPACEDARSTGHLTLVMRRNHDGRRRRDPSTYRNDAAILERALAGEQDAFLVSRYTFYLAQSWRDCGEPEKALAAYLRRAELGHWTEEIFVALLQAARIKESLDHPVEDVLATYARATSAAPTRAEALHGAAKLCRAKDRFEDGYWLAKRGAELSAPAGGLFVEPWIYDFGLLDELGVHAYWSGRYADSRDACARLLREGKMPSHMRERIEANRRFAVDKLAASFAPGRPKGGTELMVEALRERMGDELGAVNLRVNLYDPATLDSRPLVLWMHHDTNQAAVQWCNDASRVAAVACFVFVSHWQRDKYVATFGLAPERCVVIRHALAQTSEMRRWEPAAVLRCAYTSTPFRGLDLLLDAWDGLPAGKAELHIWSSMRLYAGDDAPYEHLFARARATPGVTYHGLAPNDELRAALRTMHLLAYPCTFAETACLSVIEAMAAGCRVVVPSLGALPETTGGYARIYPWNADPRAHAAAFRDVLAAEIAAPWAGRPDLCIAQQAHCAAVYDWSRHLEEWRRLIRSLRGDAAVACPPCSATSTTEAPATNVPATKASRALVGVPDALQRIVRLGFAPAGILDVGAHDGAFARIARHVFPDAHILMIDALEEKDRILADVARDLGQASHAIALLGEETRETVPFFVVDTAARPDLVTTGSSRFKENTNFPMRERSIRQSTLAELVAEAHRSFQMIKLDVQGSELDVLRGLGRHLAEIEIVLMEVSLVDYNDGAPLVAEVVRQLDAMGFVLYDFVEDHRYRDGRLLQTDALFVRPGSHLRAQPPFWS